MPSEIDKKCTSGRCSFKRNNDYLFAQTNTTDKRCGVLSYPWHDPDPNHGAETQRRLPVE